MGKANKVNMNYLTDNFSQIMDFAKDYGLPSTKKRGIIREYLQSKVIESIYRHKVSKELIFIGGTSLRLIRGLDRFSEDLDFDLLDISFSEIEKIIEKILADFKKERLEVFLYKNKTGKKTYLEMRFKNVLQALGLSNNQEEKLMIKFDFEKFWKKEDREIIFLNRYGFVTNVVTLNINQILVQKIYAYLNRRQTLARDIYDIVWLKSRGAKVDYRFVKDNHLPEDLISAALKKYEREKEILTGLKRKLKPFLFKEKNVDKIKYFKEVLQFDNQ